MTQPQDKGDASALSATKVLVIQPDEKDPLARFSGWLAENGVDTTVIQPFRGDEIPTELAADGLIVLGGSMNAYAVEQFPWLADIQALYRKAAAANIPTLGICLGAQLLAATFDGTVTVPSPIGPEIGVVDIEWTEAGRGDPLVGGLAASFRAIAFHYDGISALPEDAVLLGRGEHYPNQVFRLGNAVGVQFHPEATPELFDTWCASDAAEKPEMTDFFAQQRRRVEATDEEIVPQVYKLAKNFAAELRAAVQVQRS